MRIEPPLGCCEYSDCIQRETWCMEPYAGVDYYLALGRLQSRLQPIYHGQPYSSRPYSYARVYFIPLSGTKNLASGQPYLYYHTNTDERPPYIASPPSSFSYQIILFCLKEQCHEISDLCFCSWISFLQAPEYTIPLRQFPIFSKIRGDIRGSRCTTGVSLTLGANGKNLKAEQFL